ncbi:MAG TPA: ribosome silencing factor, partial [Armatimonadetes bacterium]|nr:ribosome silencing factor [Armatimonadota bacterium]
MWGGILQTPYLGEGVEALVLDAREKALLSLEAAVGRKGKEGLILELRGLTDFADYFVIVTGETDVHIRAIADAVIDALEAAGEKPHHVEGYEDARWVLIDCGDVIVIASVSANYGLGSPD